MKQFKTNRKGQFTIIAAVLVAVVLVAAVVSTYSAIRYSPLQEQPQVLSSIDEINLALKQVLGFTVGYYGSVLQVTGNTSYARQLATNYLQSGLVNIGDVRPEWAPSFNITTLDLRAVWYSNTSYSSGNLSVTYDLPGIGISGITYSISSRLDVQVQPSIANQACLNISKDSGEPLVDISKQSLKFYRYLNTDLTWEQVSPSATPFVYANGTYLIDLPSGVEPDSYIIKVEDSRGIVVIASSFTSYTGTLIRNSTYTDPDFVDAISNVDSSVDKGTHSSFAAQQQSPDSVCDILTEAYTGGGLTNITLVNGESFEGSFPPSNWSSTGGWHKEGNPQFVYNGSNAAGFDRSGHNSGTLTTKEFNCLGATSIYVDFWYYDNGTDNNEFALEYFDGHHWDRIYQLGNNVENIENQWTHFQQKITESKYLNSKFKIQFYSDPNDENEHAYVDLVTIREEVDITNYQLDLEEQWTNVNYTNPNQDICIKVGTLCSETLNVDVWHGGTWVNIGSLTGLVNGWKNISVTPYLTNSTFTIRFRDNSGASDSIQDNWKIDAVLLAAQPDVNFLLSQQESIIVEWLQNGTMRWLGQNLELTTNAKPIPPIPVKDIHLNQTINGVNQPVSFQIEDWASDYQIPLGLTSSATVFSSKQMIVFLIDVQVSEFTLWWNGSDNTVQTPLAYTNIYFHDFSDSNGIVNYNNGKIALSATTVGTTFKVTSQVVGKSTSSTANFMRINTEASEYGAGSANVISNGIVRDIIQQEAEWGTTNPPADSGGAHDCPNLYANVIITLPAGVSYYTYQLRLMFVDSLVLRNISDLCPIQVTTSTFNPTKVQTENGTSKGFPIVSTIDTSTIGVFSNSISGGWTAHHWSQFLTADEKQGAGIMLTDSANQKLYAFDSMPGSTSRGAIKVSRTSIELMPVSQSSVQFKTPLDITWSGAVATFDNTTPIYALHDGTTPMGLWILAEYPPTITVTAKS